MTKNARKNYSLEFKAKIILYYRSRQHLTKSTEKSLNYISRITDIDRRTISHLVKLSNADKIIESKYK